MIHDIYAALSHTHSFYKHNLPSTPPNLHFLWDRMVTSFADWDQFLPKKPPSLPVESSLWSCVRAQSLSRVRDSCSAMDCSPSGSSGHGILQARTLEWVAISFSNAWKWKVKVKSLSHARVLATPWTAAYQAPPSLGFSSQEYWSGVPLPSPHSLPSWSKTQLPTASWQLCNFENL